MAKFFDEKAPGGRVALDPDLSGATVSVDVTVRVNQD